MNLEQKATPSTGLVVAAFASIYLIWGSTYLVIRFAIETMPPFFMFGSRCVAAGVILYLLALVKGARPPTLRQWGSASLVGFLLLLGGSATIAWAEKLVPSSIAALIVAAMPLWLLLFVWKASRPSGRTLLGLGIGFAGVGLLVVNGRGYENEPLKIFPVFMCVIGTVSWAWGSIVSRTADKPASPFMTVAAQMIAGGLITLLGGVALGEGNQFSWAEISMRSILAWVYLLVFGSLIAFTAYIWLLTVSTPAKVSTYAFVNPPIAVLLGCTVGSEPFSGNMLVATVMIVVAVALIIHQGKPKESAVKSGTLKTAEEVA